MRRSLRRTFFRPEHRNHRSLSDSYPVAIYVFWGERRLGVRLRRARGLMERDEGKIANPIFKTYLTFLVFSQHPARVINGVVSMSLPAQSKASVFNQSKRAYYLGYSIKCEHSLRKLELIKCSITRHSI